MTYNVPSTLGCHSRAVLHLEKVQTETLNEQTCSLCRQLLEKSHTHINATNRHSPAAVFLTKTHRTRTKRQKVGEVFNRLVRPIIDKLVKLSASCSRCFYYRSTFSCTCVTRHCLAQGQTREHATLKVSRLYSAP